MLHTIINEKLAEAKDTTKCILKRYPKSQLVLIEPTISSPFMILTLYNIRVPDPYTLKTSEPEATSPMGYMENQSFKVAYDFIKANFL